MNTHEGQTGTVGLIVAQLKDRKEHIQKELELIQIALDALTKAWGIEVCLAKSDAIAKEMTQAQTLPEPPRAQGRPLSPSAEFKDLVYSEAAYRVLRRVIDRRAIATQTVIYRMGIGGKKVRGKDPYRTLYRTLLKDDRFVRVEGKWALADWFPPGLSPSLNSGEKAAKDESEEKERVS